MFVRSCWSCSASCSVDVVLYTTQSLANNLIGDVMDSFISSRLAVVSREAKKKQHARASSGLRDHYSELFTRMAALKF